MRSVSKRERIKSLIKNQKPSQRSIKPKKLNLNTSESGLKRHKGVLKFTKERSLSRVNKSAKYA